MNKLIIFIIIGIVSTSAKGLCTIYGAYNNHFGLEIDYVFLKRANSHNTTLVSSFGETINFPYNDLPKECAKIRGTPLIKTKHLINHMQFDSGVSPALKIFFTTSFTCELRYAGKFSWQSQKIMDCKEILDIANRYRPNKVYTEKESSSDWVNLTEDYHQASRVKSIYKSNMDNAELNFWYHITPRYVDYFSVSVLFGLKHFDINEKIKMYFTKDSTETQTSKYRTKVGNTTLGPQFGGSLEYNPYRFLTWGFVAKFGGLFNRGYQKTLMLDKNNTYLFRFVDKSRSNFAYFGQFFPFIELRPSKSFFLNFNYQVLYVGDIMTASQNVKFYDSGLVMNRRGHIIYHGLTGGIQFNF